MKPTAMAERRVTAEATKQINVRRRIGVVPILRGPIFPERNMLLRQSFYCKYCIIVNIFLLHQDYIPFLPSHGLGTLSAMRGGSAVNIKQLVGMNIRAARKAKGLTQFELAERSGLSADFIGKVERGTTSPSIESLKHVAEALHVSLPDLFEGAGEGAPPKEALIQLNRLCKDRENEEIELVLGIAQLIFQRTRDRSRKR